VFKERGGPGGGKGYRSCPGGPGTERASSAAGFDVRGTRDTFAGPRHTFEITVYWRRTTWEPARLELEASWKSGGPRRVQPPLTYVGLGEKHCSGTG